MSSTTTGPGRLRPMARRRGWTCAAVCAHGCRRSVSTGSRPACASGQPPRDCGSSTASSRIPSGPAATRRSGGTPAAWPVPGLSDTANNAPSPPSKPSPGRSPVTHARQQRGVLVQRHPEPADRGAAAWTVPRHRHLLRLSRPNLSAKAIRRSRGPRPFSARVGERTLIGPCRSWTGRVSGRRGKGASWLSRDGTAARCTRRRSRTCPAACPAKPGCRRSGCTLSATARPRPGGGCGEEGGAADTAPFRGRRHLHHCRLRAARWTDEGGGGPTGASAAPSLTWAVARAERKGDPPETGSERPANLFHVAEGNCGGRKHQAPLAQLAEQLALNQRVRGSSP